MCILAQHDDFYFDVSHGSFLNVQDNVYYVNICRINFESNPERIDSKISFSFSKQIDMWTAGVALVFN